MKKSNLIQKIISPVSAAAAQLGRRGRSLWRVLAMSLADDHIAPKKCLSVFMEESGIAVVYASRFLSRLKIRGIRHYPLEGRGCPSPEVLASKVALAVRDLKAEKARVILVIPKSCVILKETDFPAAVKDNLADVVSYEFDRLTPLSPDKACYDFGVLTEEEGRLHILLAAMKGERLQAYADALKEKGILLDRASVSLSALGTFIQYFHRKGNHIFIGIREGGYEGGLIRQGRWVTSFQGNFTSVDTQARAGQMAEAITAASAAAKKKGGVPKIYVDPPQPEPYSSALADRIQAPVRSVAKTPLPSLFLNRIKAEDISFPALGGVLEALWPGRSGMNLFDKGRHRKSGLPVAPTVVLATLLAVLCLFWILSPLQIEAQKTELIDREIAARRDEVKKIEVLKKDLEGVEKEVGTIHTFKNARPMVLVMIREMTQILPKNTWLSRARMTETTVEIEGYAASATDILPKLEASPYFRKVEFATPTVRDSRMNMDRFNIKMEFEESPEKKAAYETKQ